MNGQNLFRISTGKYFGLINEQGDVLIKPAFAGLGDVRPEGIIATRDGRHYGVIDERGRFIIKPTFEGLGAFFSCHLLAAKKGKFGYISSDGTTAIDFKFRSASQFFEERAAVQAIDGYCFIGKDGIPLTRNRYSRVRFFSCSRAGVVIDSQLGFIDSSGELIISPKFNPLLSSSFHNSYSSVVKDEMWGIINLAGEYVIPPEFGFTGNVSNEGIAAVQSLDGKWMYVNVRTSVKSNDCYEFAGKFSQGRAIVKIDERCYLINDLFKILKFIECDKSIDVVPGYMIIEYRGREGVIDCEGDIVIPCRYDQITWSSGDIFEFTDDNHYGYVNSRGREIWRSNKQ